MVQWKSWANSSGSPKWAIQSFRSRRNRGSGGTQLAANNANLVVNVTSDSFTRGEVNGVFPVTPGAKANTTSSESTKVHGLGWALRTAGEGPIQSYNVSAAGSIRYSNGETINVSNGNGTNGTLVITTTGTSNLASVAFGNGAVGPTYSVNTAAVFTFTREQHVANLNFSNSTALTNVGNGNTININVSNTNIPYGVNATASITSNSTGGITNTITQAIAWGGTNWGLFANNQTNTAVVITFTNANGALVGGTFTATANLVTSTGGSVSANRLGGRAGRVTYEMLVIDRHINASVTSSVANSAGILPE